MDYLVSLSSREWDGERASWAKEAERCRKRLDELDAIIRKLYEDSVFGRISEERIIARLCPFVTRNFPQMRISNTERRIGEP